METVLFNVFINDRDSEIECTSVSLQMTRSQAVHDSTKGRNAIQGDMDNLEKSGRSH